LTGAVISGEPTRRIRWSRIAGLLVATAAVGAVLGHDLPPSSSATATSPTVHSRGHGEADGSVPAGTTVFDDGIPGVARLAPALRSALRRAASDAAADGVTFVVDSGWRSRAYQARLLREAVAKYGSPAAAARWVATPDRSAHVSGDAVDMGSGAAAWLSAHGAAYGLCRVYGNEPWHYELREDAVAHGCPPMYADPTQDPRSIRPRRSAGAGSGAAAR
jgi:zinc D-Ala-D-Ala carboxypeptidase